MPPSSAGSAASFQDSDSAAKYTKLKDIASGNSGFVVEAVHHSTGKHYAIKYIPRGAAINKYVAREIVHHSGMLHPHIVAFWEVFLTEEHLAIVMEYVNGGDMFQYVKRRGGLKEDEARWYFQQLVMAVSYCHSMGIVNRDIKLENALLVDLKRPILKLCDFGYSKHEEDSRPKTWVGTPGYTAPEVMLKEQYDGKKADVWSSGVFLCVMLFCKYPFGLPDGQAAGESDTIRRFLQWLESPHCRVSPGQASLSPAARSLLLQMLCPDPAARISMAEVCKHPWFTQNLPAAAIRINDECLRLSGNGRGPGCQTPEEIRAVLAHAMAPLAQDAAALEDDVIRRPTQPPGSHSEEDMLYQDADAMMY